MKVVSVLVLGASYGLLLAARLAQTKAHVTLVCTTQEQQNLHTHGAEVDFLNKQGSAAFQLRIPVQPGRATQAGQLGVVDCDVDLHGIDIVFLAFSEPQCATSQPSALLSRIAQKRLPVVSLMNCLPPPYLRRLKALQVDTLIPAYSAWPVWSQFDPSTFTAASPDAQAFRPNGSLCGLHVGLWSNFKVAPFHHCAHQVLVQQLASDMQQVRVEGQRVPVDLVAHSSLTVPLAKWPMLMTGNYRCTLPNGDSISIAKAVWQNIEMSRQIYEWVLGLALACGAVHADLVPFRVYATVAKSLNKPSSVARALQSQQAQVERVDKLVQLAAASLGKFNPEIDRIVELIDFRLAQSKK